MTLESLIGTLPPRLSRWAKELLGASICYGVDPLILAAIMDRESQGGDALKPPGAGGFGDGGHGRGLMQIDDRSHTDFVSCRFGRNGLLWQDPAFNVLYAAKLLRKNLDACGGKYPPAIAGYNASMQRVMGILLNSVGDASIEQLDALTTGGNYVTDVLAKRLAFSPLTQGEIQT